MSTEFFEEVFLMGNGSDKRIAMKVARAIMYADALLFAGDSIQRIIVDPRNPSEMKLTEHVHYVPGHGCSKEHYLVFEEGIADWVATEKCSPWLLDVLHFTPWCQQVLSNVPEDYFILALAAHEVRHRLQYKSGVAYFKPDNVSGLYLSREMLYYLQRYLYGIMRDPDAAQSEFDAFIVEYCILQELTRSGGMSDDKMMAYIRLTPARYASRTGICV